MGVQVPWEVPALELPWAGQASPFQVGGPVGGRAGGCRGSAGGTLAGNSSKEGGADCVHQLLALHHPLAGIDEDVMAGRRPLLARRPRDPAWRQRPGPGAFVQAIYRWCQQQSKTQLELHH